MGILTIPTINKSVSANLGLSKADLFALAPVVADSYFSVQANVRYAHFVYVSNPGKQIEIVRFDLSAASPSAPFLVSARSREVFELQRVILEDHDGGTLVMERAQLPSGFDVTLGAAPITGFPSTGLVVQLDSDVGFTQTGLEGPATWVDQVNGTPFNGFIKGMVNNIFGTKPGLDFSQLATSKTYGTEITGSTSATTNRSMLREGTTLQTRRALIGNNPLSVFTVVKTNTDPNSLGSTILSMGARTTTNTFQKINLKLGLVQPNYTTGGVGVDYDGNTSMSYSTKITAYNYSDDAKAKVIGFVQPGQSLANQTLSYINGITGPYVGPSVSGSSTPYLHDPVINIGVQNDFSNKSPFRWYGAVYVYNRALDAGEIAQLNAYLMDRYGVVA